MTREFIDSPEKTLQALDELIESAEKIRRKCRNKNYYANDMLCSIINQIQEIQGDIEASKPEWEKVMNEG
jgi:hypothetical protein